MTTTNLTNINFMSKDQFDSLETKNNNELYAVPIPDNLVTTDTLDNYVTVDTDQTITSSKKFNASIAINHSNLTKGTDPASTSYAGLAFDDNSSADAWQDRRLAVVESSVLVDGSSRLFLAAYRNLENSSYSAALNIICPKNTDPYVLCPASKNDGSVCTTVTSKLASNGFVKLGNGIIIQWGYYNSTSSGTVTLPTAFTSTNYSVAISLTGGTSNNEYARYWNTGSYTTTSFSVESSAKTGARKWIAVGY